MGLYKKAMTADIDLVLTEETGRVCTIHKN